MGARLTSQQLTFVLAMVETGDPVEAARRAGYRDPVEAGPRLMRDKAILAAIRARTGADGEPPEDIEPGSGVVTPFPSTNRRILPGTPQQRPRKPLRGEVQDDEAIEFSRGLTRAYALAAINRAMLMGLGELPIAKMRFERRKAEDGTITYESVQYEVREVNLPAAIAAATRLNEEMDRRVALGIAARDEHAVEVTTIEATRLSPDISRALADAIATSGPERKVKT